MLERLNLTTFASGVLKLIMSTIFTFFGFVVLFLFITSASEVCEKLLPWFSIFTRVAFFLVVFILLPLAIPKATRNFASTAMYISSYVFGTTLWMIGFLWTLAIWGG